MNKFYLLILATFVVACTPKFKAGQTVRLKGFYDGCKGTITSWRNERFCIRYELHWIDCGTFTSESLSLCEEDIQ